MRQVLQLRAFEMFNASHEHHIVLCVHVSTRYFWLYWKFSTLQQRDSKTSAMRFNRKTQNLSMYLMLLHSLWLEIRNSKSFLLKLTSHCPIQPAWGFGKLLTTLSSLMTRTMRTFSAHRRDWVNQVQVWSRIAPSAKIEKKNDFTLTKRLQPIHIRG